MFYFPEVLKKRGKFATIWLAATKAVKLSRREYIQVNVNRSCSDILEHITLRVRPRFALYLSAQLMYGVVFIFNKQCAFLADDIRSHLERLFQSSRSLQIDLDDRQKSSFTIPDMLTIMEQTLGAPDPWFGVMSFKPGYPLPSMLPKCSLEIIAQDESEEIMARSPSAVSITMRPVEGISKEELMEQADLPEMTMREIEALLSPHLVAPFVPSKPERGKDLGVLQEEDEEDVTLEKVRLEEKGLLESILSEQDWGFPQEEISAVPTAAAVPSPALEPSVAEIPKARTIPSPPSLSPSHPPLPPPLGPESPLLLELPSLKEGEDEVPRGIKRRRQPSLDERTQLAAEEMRAFIDDPRAHCKDLILIPPSQPPSVQSLFDEPACGWLHPALKTLWMNCNKKPPLDWHPSPASETISSPVSEVEILRATTIEPSPVFGISEEIPTIHSEERTEGTPALQAKEETFARALPERIPEVVEELLSPTMPLPAESSPINEIFQRLMRELSALTEETDLNSLLPPGCPKTLAARAFMLCLNLAARRVVMLWQSEPYGPIHIRPGPHFSVLIPLQVGDPEFEGEEDDDEDEGEQQEEEEEGGEEQHEEEIEEEGGVEEGYEEEAMDI